MTRLNVGAVVLLFAPTRIAFIVAETKGYCLFTCCPVHARIVLIAMFPTTSWGENEEYAWVNNGRNHLTGTINIGATQAGFIRIVLRQIQ